MFLGVCSIGEARELLNLTSLKLLQFVYFQNCRNSDRRAKFIETLFRYAPTLKQEIHGSSFPC